MPRPSAPPKARVALYRAAPGQRAALLRYFAAQDRASQAAGLPPSQIYAHTDGDSWGYLAIDPVTKPAQDAAVDAAAKKMGLPTGPASNLELRKYISQHSDTFTIGPVTAAQYLAMAVSQRRPAASAAGRMARLRKDCPTGGRLWSTLVDSESRHNRS